MAYILLSIKIEALRRCFHIVQTHKIEFKRIFILNHQVIIKMFQMRKWGKCEAVAV
nr:MAG TPA: hypothetical protein [Bacteriophage sp.]